MRSSFIVLAVVAAAIIGALGFLSTQAGVRAVDAMIPRFIDHWAAQCVHWFAYRNNREWNNFWYGVPMSQFPTDLLIYENLITESKPDMIIETGTWCGGLTLYLAALLDRSEAPGLVATIDINPTRWENIGSRAAIKKSIMDRITFIQGSSTAAETFNAVRDLARGRKCVLVILDSDHSAAHVLAELNLFAALVTPGSYLIVNDTARETWGHAPGPLAAVVEFLRNHPEFVIDTLSERYAVSCMHSGILKRLR